MMFGFYKHHIKAEMKKDIAEQLWGCKASILRELSKDENFAEYIPPMVFIPDTVFSDFMRHNAEMQRKLVHWYSICEKVDQENTMEEFAELKLFVTDFYIPFLREQLPSLPEMLREKIGFGKDIIIRSSGTEDMEGTMNAGGNRSIPNVKMEDVYEGIAEVTLSYFSPHALYNVKNRNLKFDAFKCPVFIQEMIGSVNEKIQLQDYPVLDTKIIQKIADRILKLRERFQREVDTEWVLRQGKNIVSIVGFSNEPYFDADAVYLLCSLGCGCAVRRTAVVNAMHYILPYDKEYKWKSLAVEYPEKETEAHFFAEGSTDIFLVQCRPKVSNAGYVRVNKNVSAMVQEYRKRPAFAFETIIKGTGDADGRFLVSESLSEAWDELTAGGDKAGYVGCVVRYGSALEHAGIMFTEKGMPVVKVKDEVFMQLAVKSGREFVLAQSCGLLFEKEKNEKYDYSYEKMDHLSRGAIRGTIVFLSHKSWARNEPPAKQTAELWDGDESSAKQTADGRKKLIPFLKEVKQIMHSGTIAIARQKELSKMIKTLYVYSTGAMKSIFMLAGQIFDEMSDCYRIGDEKNRLFWEEMLRKLWSNDLVVDCDNEKYNFSQSFIDFFCDERYNDSVRNKLELLELAEDDICLWTKHKNLIALLFSIPETDSHNLSDHLKELYRQYNSFAEKFGLPANTYAFHSDMDIVSRIFERNLQNDKVVERIVKYGCPFEILKLYFYILDKQSINGDLWKSKIQEVLLLSETTPENIRSILVLFCCILFYGGLGDIDIILDNMDKRMKIEKTAACMKAVSMVFKIESIFDGHHKGILDPDISMVGEVREILIEDLSLFGNPCQEWSAEFSPIRKNMIANIISMVIDLFDIEGKTYANSLAMGILAVYPSYLCHLKKWNDFLDKVLLKREDEYSDVYFIVKRKLCELSDKRNNNIQIQVDNVWYEKIYMNIDFNLHELQNILHQASIYFAHKSNQFCESSVVEKIHQKMITFGLDNRRLLKNQVDCIEVELGLGNHKIHKSSILIQPGSISAQYAEAPLISIGRLIVMQKIFSILNDHFEQYHIAARMQRRNGDHLLFLDITGAENYFDTEMSDTGIEMICSVFDAFELGGGIEERDAEQFVSDFCCSRIYEDFIVCMIKYHARLSYSGDMGGGFEENDICLYQSILALIVIFPERFDFLRTEERYEDVIGWMMWNAEKEEWQTDPYDLKRGWLKKAYCLCLAILYPEELREELKDEFHQGNRIEKLGRHWCELYLSIVS